MILLAVIVSFIIGAFALCYRDPKSKRINRPPGARSPPLLILLQAFSSPHVGKYLQNLGNSIGPIAYMKFGPFRIVLLSTREFIHEACKLTVLNGRSDCLYKDIMRERGMLWPDDTSEKRKAIFRSSRHFGLGLKSVESNIHDEIGILFKHFDNSHGQAIKVKGVFNIPTFNGVAHRLLGEKYPHDDPALKKVVGRLDVFMELPGPIYKACAFVPSLTKWVPASISGRKFLEEFFLDLQNIVETLLQKHYRTRVPNQPRDLADALMDEVEATTDVNSPIHSSQDPIRYIMVDMMLAALETTGALLEWAILYLSHFPKIQTRLQAEIDDVIGRERLPELSDRPKMPYLQAFLQEMFRIAPVIPFGFHMAYEDTNFKGYTIEKGTYFLENFYAAHMDPKVWENPEEFKPERFINSNGEFTKSDQLFIFGSGRRSCVGEVTARDQLFLYLSRLLQAYHIDPEKKIESLVGNMAMGYHAPDFMVNFTRRA